MGTDVTQERQQVHALLDLLPAEKLTAVRGLLEVMVEPLSRSLPSASVEQGEARPETAAELDRTRASLKLGEGNFFANQTIAELADAQKVVPLRDLSALAGGISTEDDVDELLKDIYDARK